MFIRFILCCSLLLPSGQLLAQTEQTPTETVVKEKVIFDVRPILGKTHKVFEKKLGKRVGGDKVEGVYRVKGFKEVMVLGSKTMDNIAFVFSKPAADWKAALKRVGIDSAGAELADPGKMAGKAEYIKNIKGVPKGWGAVWTPANNELGLFSPNSP